MIGRISGRLDWRGPDHVLIDVRGVGYIIYVSERTLAGMPSVGEAVSLYTDLLVREDLLQLFGFPTMLEKEWHKLLTTVQGVGAKAAMAILGTLGAEGVGRAITLGDARSVQAAPGVGPKLAQRVILELKAKAPGVMAHGHRRFRPHALHSHQQLVPLLLQHGREAEQLQKVLPHQKVGIQRHRLANRRHGSQGPLTDVNDIPDPAHVDQHMVRPAPVQSSRDPPDHSAALNAAASRPDDCT